MEISLELLSHHISRKGFKAENCIVSSCIENKERRGDTYSKKIDTYVNLFSNTASYELVVNDDQEKGMFSSIQEALDAYNAIELTFKDEK